MAIAALLLFWLSRTTEAQNTNHVSRHWAFEPVRNQPLPPVKNASWPHTPIDRFILARLEERGIHPASPADKRTLLRRATFDLTGLPPTPEEVDAFLADNSPHAFASVIDRLLASPRYGERWGRHWLDVARYADSNGMDENLAYANAWRYRDYVVAAFNRDKPYDQFIREQIAGDLLPLAAPNADPSEQITATGFLTIGPKMLAEDDPVKMEMDIIDEQLDTTCRLFMGLTVGCARCHDHKYDPIPMADYYAMAGILKSTKTMENFKVVARWQERPLGPLSEVEKWQAHKKSMDEQNKRINALVSDGNNELLREARRRVADYLLAATEQRTLDRWLKEAKPIGDALKTNAPHGFILIEAENFQRHENVMVTTNGYGEGIGIIYGPGGKPNVTEYDVPLTSGGLYRVELRYAAAESRPVKLILNGKLAKPEVAGKVTGSWNPDTQTWRIEGFFRLNAGTNVVRLERADCIPHIDKLLFVPAAESEAEKFAGASDPAPDASQLIPEFVTQWTKYLEKTEKATNSVLSVWHEFLSRTRAGEEGEGLHADWRKHDSVALTPALASGDRAEVRRKPAFDSPTTLVLFRDEAPRSLAELAHRYGEQFAQADVAWQQLKLSTNGAKADQLSDPVQESFRQVFYDAQGPFAVPKNSESYFQPNRVAELKQEREHLKGLEQSFPALPEAMAVADGQPVNLHIHKRGSHLSLGEEAPRGFLRVVNIPPPSSFEGKQSGRWQLADWLASPENPLTARVMVNRIWLWHFGEGLVRSPDNFGKLGESPTHPELLDWLARHFIESGWSMKAMHRLIMNSATWQQRGLVISDSVISNQYAERQSDRSAPQAGGNRSLTTDSLTTDYSQRIATLDPDNRLLSHFPRRRLEVEAIRDAILLVGGNLDLRMGGSLMTISNRNYVTSTANKIDHSLFEKPVRSLYLPVVRSALYDLFQVFDFADPSVMNGRRDQTTVAPQALFMLNSRLVADAARSLAKSMIGENKLDDSSRLEKVYRIAYSRLPTSAEIAAGLKYLARYAEEAAALGVKADESRLKAWQSLCRSVIAANEFIYPD